MNKPFHTNPFYEAFTQKARIPSEEETMTIGDVKKHINDAKRIKREARYLSGDPDAGVIKTIAVAKDFSPDWQP